MALIKYPDDFYKPAQVIFFKWGNSNAILLTGCGVYKLHVPLHIFGYDTHMTHYSNNGTVSSGEKNKVTGFSLLQRNLVLNVSKIYR